MSRSSATDCPEIEATCKQISKVHVLHETREQCTN